MGLSSAFAILAASIAGSVHCVGMCGGLMLSATGPKMSNQFIYHFFRFLGYISLGALAGHLGQELFEWRWLPAQILVSLAFVALVLFKVPSLVANHGMKFGFKWAGEKTWLRAALIGLFTVFLPCGWLYSFVLLAVATHSLPAGIAVLTLFWLGTLPAMVFSRVILQTVFARIGVSGRRAVTAIMLTAALFSVYEHWKNSFVVKKESSSEIGCHTK